MMRNHIEAFLAAIGAIAFGALAGWLFKSAVVIPVCTGVCG
jgi:hypothetical protein